jgi:glycosyltransferase involved in cell wall biosynthesis
VRLFINKIGQGSAASRHRMMQEARGEWVLAIDDDSYPEPLNCLEILSGVFEARPRLAIASFPQRTDEYPQSL